MTHAAPPPALISWAAATHAGRVRTNNEDAHLATDGLWVVADGMGGHVGGEVASATAVRAAAEAQPGSGAEIAEAFAAAHAAVVAATTTELRGMGTTMVLTSRCADGTLLVGNVGDSRAYLLGADGLVRVTADDNEAEQLLARGAITAEQARTHPGQSMLTASLGGSRASIPPPAVYPLPAAGGRLLLCSDGLNSELTDPRIAELLGRGTPQEAADALSAAAVEAGGRDNVTVVVVDL